MISSSAQSVATRPAPRLAIVPKQMHTPVTVRLGMRLRDLRKKHNLTQRQLADRFGIDRSYVSELERGHKSLSLTTLEIFAVGFKMPLSELLRDI
ncbi:Helix-turn-helix [Terriglobus roseus]|uniref:Helix-turn-helix n=2 Tax=Terriglobus roseus TaxID=392734 RepID=A0A1H4IZM7_9BACT|nr:Helix-turn-helix [Terriglobus roseus]